MIPFTPNPWVEYITYPIAWIAFFAYSLIFLKKKGFITNRKVFVKFFGVIFVCFWLFARLWYFIRGFIIGSVPTSDWIRFLDLEYGGNATFGMLLGGIIGLLLAFRIYIWGKSENMPKISRIADELVPAALIFGVIVRVGCLFDGHEMGKQTNLPWALQYPGEAFGRHPVAAYDLIIFLLILTSIYIIFRYEKTEKTLLGKRYDTQIFLWFMLWFSARYLLKFFLSEQQMPLIILMCNSVFFILTACSFLIMELFPLVCSRYRTYQNFNDLVFKKGSNPIFPIRFLYYIIFCRKHFKDKKKMFI